MQVFAVLRGSKNEQKLHPRPLVIRVLFRLQKNTLPTSILAPLGPLLGAPRRLQEASKPSPKPLLEASWAILAASSIFWPPGGYPRARFFNIFDQNVMLFSRLLIKVLLLLRDSFAQRIASQPPWIFSFSTSQSCSIHCPFELLFVGVRVLLQPLFCTPALFLV